jgi:hypothetical protein
MEEISSELTIDEVVRRFVACAICVGYCRDSGRQDFADVVQEDAKGLFALLRKMSPDWMDILLELARTHDDLWVRYFALIYIGTVDPARAADGIHAIAEADKGFVSAAAMLERFRFGKYSPEGSSGREPST